MPELPEVETIVRRLQAVLPGKLIQDVTVYKEKSFQGEVEQVIGQTVSQVTRGGKTIRIHLGSDRNILTHLKMTGQLIYVDKTRRLGGGHPTADWVTQLPSAHTRVSYTFSDGSQLFFNDMRIFGWMRVLTDEGVEREWSSLGPDITDPALSVEHLQAVFARRSSSLKLVILDGTVMSGLGNIYACDALNVAQLSPFRSAQSLLSEEIDRLLRASRQVINKGIELGGTTFDGRYVDSDGMAGSYQDRVQVYGREGKSCYQCGGLIVKTKLGGRGTYYCSQCQA